MILDNISLPYKVYVPCSDYMLTLEITLAEFINNRIVRIDKVIFVQNL